MRIDLATVPAKGLVEQAELRAGAQNARLNAYAEYEGAYFDDVTSRELGAVRAMNNDGRVVMRKMDEFRKQMASRGGAPNLIRSMIRSVVAIRGQWPTCEVQPEDIDQGQRDSKHGELALRRTRILREQHDHSNMVEQQFQMAWFLSTFGEGAYAFNVRTPEEAKDDPLHDEPAGVYWQVIDPRNALPRFRFGAHRQELADLLCMWKLTAETAYDEFGVTSTDETVPLVIYYGTQFKRVVVGEREIARVEHGLGFCPAEWVSNEATDGRAAQADISGLPALQMTMQHAFHVYMDSQTWATYPALFTKGDFDKDDFGWGPGEHLSGAENAEAHLLAPAANPQASKLIFDETKDALMQGGGVSPVNIEGLIDRSNVSARSVNAQMSPMEQRMAASNVRLAAAIKRGNRKTMLMLYRTDALKNATLTLHGQDANGRFAGTYSGDDMGGWTANIVKFDALMALNRHERVAIMVQLFKDGLVSGPRVLREAGEDDPDRTYMEAVEFHIKQQALQQGQQPGGPPQQGGPQQPGNNGDPNQAAREQMQLAMGGNPGGGGPPGGQPSPGGGGPPQAAPPPLAPFSRMQGSPTGRAQPTTVPDVQGQLFAVAEPAVKFGTILELHEEGYRGGGIVCRVSDHRDVAAVKAALSKWAEQHGNVKVKVLVGSRNNNNGRAA